MHIIDAHKAASECANEAVFDRYGTYEWHPGSPAHDVWLAVYDRVFARLIIKGE